MAVEGVHILATLYEVPLVVQWRLVVPSVHVSCLCGSLPFSELLGFWCGNAGMDTTLQALAATRHS